MIEMILIALGVALLIGEAFIPLFGLIGISGLALVITGALLTFNDSLLQYGWPTLFAVSLAIAVMMGACGVLLAKRFHKKTRIGGEDLIGESARVTDWSGKQGRVHVKGKNWHASSQRPLKLKTDDIVSVIAVDGLSLTVIPRDELLKDDD